MDQDEAVKANSLPETVEIQGAGTEADKDSRAYYLASVEKAKPFMAPFGYTDFEAFVRQVGSDPILARKVILHATDVEKADGNMGNFNSPQEKNVTGILDHAVHPPTIKETVHAE